MATFWQHFDKIKAYNLDIIKVVSLYWYPQQGSNLYLPLRRGLFYPLNYEGIYLNYIIDFIITIIYCQHKEILLIKIKIQIKYIVLIFC